MPIKTKTIIQSLREVDSSFTKDELYSRIIKYESQKDKSRGQRQRQKKSKKVNASLDFSEADIILNHLISCGFVTKEKKTYHKNNDLIFEGTVTVSQGNDAYALFNGLEIIIKREDLNTAQNSDLCFIEITDFRKGYFFGRVNSVLKRLKNIFVGRVISRSSSITTLTLLDTPNETKVYINNDEKTPENWEYAALELTNKKFSGMIEAKALEYFKEDDETFDFLRIRTKHSLPDPHHKSLSASEIRVPENELKNRKDYRRLFTITIDGDTAKDFDDAISIRENKKSIKLYVHIADVSAYVFQSSEIDLEAYKRGTSYYLGDRVIPMLPEVLSNNLCSLREGEERLSLTAEMTFDSSGNMTKFESYRGIIKVNKRLTYKKAEELLKDKSATALGKKLKQMMRLAAILRKKRIKEGKIDLNLTDQELIYENGKVKEIRFVSQLQSQSLIEEFMLSANEAVSRRLKENSIPALYRVHEKISEENIISLKNFLKTLGLKLKDEKNLAKSIQTVLKEVSGKDYQQVVNFVILRSMMQAYYGTVPLGHFGLGFPDYTHFTSPIRRYPDLIVHRCLKSLMDNSQPPYNTEELNAIGEKSSQMERVAQKAERDFIKIKACRLMKNFIGQEFDAIISGLTKSGIFVTLNEIPVEGMIPLRNITDDFYVFREEDFMITGRQNRRKFILGDKIRVRLTASDIDTMRIDFEPAELSKKQRKRKKR
ncbi:MAG TPA: VacB/RNase II family 3'-5' exoribonuclease [Spirochaetota bacterium]|jgi:ribonuclease R|nr:VacB/RNase II family 3'-5' exoribonuclease [Spirochaetota bacterium]HOK92805.1 VacB/RNase II family 3'-5' exoribonuclease [Spirochaetota bacterium]HON15748.1 VacB/RNase II family 3'-5' exoribonuclease [Spirochaetota bacterium]HPD77504.1 VacB/RNase II family 3'-5' exoribonuclease [Spirochaetota bacterium]HPP95291.1 VacB/RNase II family 3'-5' exoribonuclease [Spirochaetota bacterium]